MLLKPLYALVTSCVWARVFKKSGSSILEFAFANSISSVFCEKQLWLLSWAAWSSKRMLLAWLASFEASNSFKLLKYDFSSSKLLYKFKIWALIWCSHSRGIMGVFAWVSLAECSRMSEDDGAPSWSMCIRVKALPFSYSFWYFSWLMLTSFVGIVSGWLSSACWFSCGVCWCRTADSCGPS